MFSPYIRCSNDDFTILLVWVDDFISISTTDNLNNVTEHDLKGHFDIKSLRLPNLLLEMKVHVGNKIISISQAHYIDSLLTKFGLTNMNPVVTPMDPNVKLNDYDKSSKTELEGEEDLNKKITHGYTQSIATCLDIAFAINKLAQYTSNPKPLHWTAVKHIFCYLKYTQHHALTYGGEESILTPDLKFFCNANWANN